MHSYNQISKLTKLENGSALMDTNYIDEQSRYIPRVALCVKDPLGVD